MQPQKVGSQRRFSTAVCERIQLYVYVLRDPRDGSIFYVGKGTGNLVFKHAYEAIESPKATDMLGTGSARSTPPEAGSTAGSCGTA